MTAPTMIFHDVFSVTVETLPRKTYSVVMLKLETAEMGTIEIDCYSLVENGIDLDLTDIDPGGNYYVTKGGLTPTPPPLDEDRVREFLAGVNLTILERLMGERREMMTRARITDEIESEGSERK